MQAGFEFLATSVIFALVFVTWMVYESVQAWKRHSRRNLLRKPEGRCVSDAGLAMWMGRKW